MIVLTNPDPAIPAAQHASLNRFVFPEQQVTFSICLPHSLQCLDDARRV